MGDLHMALEIARILLPIVVIVAILLSMFIPFSTLSAIAWGPGIVMLFGYFAYEIYSKK